MEDEKDDVLVGEKIEPVSNDIDEAFVSTDPPLCRAAFRNNDNEVTDVYYSK